MKGKKIFGTMAAAVLSVALLTGCSSGKAIDPADYVSVDYSGYNGEATAFASFNEAQFERDRVKVEEDEQDEIETMRMEFALEDDLSYSVSPNSGLSNGDKVTLTIEYDKDILKEYGYTLKGNKSITYEVSGLEDYVPPEEIKLDAFAEDGLFSENGLTITFSGISPYCSVEVINNFPEDDIRSQVMYTADVPYGTNIKKGEAITITASLPSSLTNVSADNTYYSLKEKSIEVTCDNVQSYVASLDEISDEDLNAIIEKCNELCEEYLNNEVYNIYINSIDYVGASCALTDADSVENVYLDRAYLVSLKDGETANWFSTVYGNLYITYHVSVYNIRNTDFEDAYWLVSIKNPVLDTDGSLIINLDSDLKMNQVQVSREALETYLENEGGGICDVTYKDISNFTP